MSIKFFKERAIEYIERQEGAKVRLESSRKALDNAKNPVQAIDLRAKVRGLTTEVTALKIEGGEAKKDLKELVAASRAELDDMTELLDDADG